MRLVQAFLVSLGASVFGVAWVAPASAGERLVVHEWGTFTALQAEDGRAIGGINTDDEPLPEFVHNLHRNLLQTPTEMPSVYFKGTPRVHPDVVVRLETPVVYFYPPDRGPDAGKPLTLDVDVSFRGGWLTQYYPDARATAPGVDNNKFDFGPLTPGTTGSLAWRGLSVGGTAPGPQTTSPAWLAPRDVPAAASVRTPGGEAERYLFYRGVGNLPSPLRVSRGGDGADARLLVHAQFDPHLKLQPDFARGPLWLLDVRDDGACAFATIDRADLVRRDGRPIASFAPTFPQSSYATANLAAIRRSLHAALVADGLFADEAEALLNTWETSYFRRPGLRLFFLVPQQWTDHVMPLRVSASAEIRRVMVGRVEVVTPEQRGLLKQVAAGPVSQANWVHAALAKSNGGREDFYREQWYAELLNGSRALSSMNVEIPADYRAYLNLGRFRNALILDEQARRPSPNLATFIERYDLEAHDVKRATP